MEWTTQLDDESQRDVSPSSCIFFVFPVSVCSFVAHPARVVLQASFQPHVEIGRRRFPAIVCKHLRASQVFSFRVRPRRLHASSKRVQSSLGEPDDPIIRESRGVPIDQTIIRQSTLVLAFTELDESSRAYRNFKTPSAVELFRGESVKSIKDA